MIVFYTPTALPFLWLIRLSLERDETVKGGKLKKK